MNTPSARLSKDYEHVLCGLPNCRGQLAILTTAAHRIAWSMGVCESRGWTTLQAPGMDELFDPCRFVLLSLPAGIHETPAPEGVTLRCFRPSARMERRVRRGFVHDCTLDTEGGLRGNETALVQCPRCGAVNVVAVSRLFEQLKAVLPAHEERRRELMEQHPALAEEEYRRKQRAHAYWNWQDRVARRLRGEFDNRAL